MLRRSLQISLRRLLLLVTASAVLLLIAPRQEISQRLLVRNIIHAEVVEKVARARAATSLESLSHSVGELQLLRESVERSPAGRSFRDRYIAKIDATLVVTKARADAAWQLALKRGEYVWKSTNCPALRVVHGEAD